MKAKARSPLNIFSLSFMDCICCGFGAVILLFVLNKGSITGAIQNEYQTSQEEVNRTNLERASIMIDSLKMEMQRDTLKIEIEQITQKIARLNQETSTLLADTDTVKTKIPDLSKSQTLVTGMEKKLYQAKQRLEKLRRTPKAWDADAVGGIPADSEYVIIVVDVSYSMVSDQNMLDTINDKIFEIVSMYPEAKGFQILTSDGSYMLDRPNGRSRWNARIPPNPNLLSVLMASINTARLTRSKLAGTWVPGDREGRQKIYNAMINYVEAGIGCLSDPQYALEEIFHSYNRKEEEISVFILGDDFYGSAQPMIDFLARKNPDGRIRINGVGFPSILYESSKGAFNFANAMRWISSENGGAFVGISP